MSGRLCQKPSLEFLEQCCDITVEFLSLLFYLLMHYFGLRTFFFFFFLIEHTGGEQTFFYKVQAVSILGFIACGPNY